MAIQFERGNDLDELLICIRARIEHLKKEKILFDTVFTVLKTFEGKPITKRIATAIEKLIGRRAYLYQQYGLIYLDIERQQDDQIRLFYGRGDIEKSKNKYTNSPTRDAFIRIYLRAYPQSDLNSANYKSGLSYDECSKANPWGSSFLENIAAFQKGIDQLPYLVKEFNTGLEILKRTFSNAEKYGLEYYFDIPA